MEFRETWNGKSYTQIPDTVLERVSGSLKAAYIYAKIKMLAGKIYIREAWVKNPYTGKQEMSIDTFSDTTTELEQAGLIRKVKEDVGTQYKANRYEIVPLSTGYKSVYYDFINHTELSADAKGLAILMSLLKFIPKSNNAIGKAVGISGKTVKKYLAELITYGIYDPQAHILNEDCFPFYRQVREKRAKKQIEAYKQWIQLDDNQVPANLRRQLAYVQSLPESLASQARIWEKVSAGLWATEKTKDEKKENKPIIL